MKYLLFIFTFTSLLLAKEACNAQNNKSLHYKVDHSVLTKAHLVELDTWLELISLDSLVGIKITGHTDSSASLAYNIVLSQKRAKNIENYFLKKGISEKLIQFAYHGEQFANSTTNLSYDRRVDIELSFAKKAIIDTKPIAKPEIASTTTIQDFYRAISPKPQEFCINPQKDTIIRCKYGTLVTIKANSFELSSKQKASNLCVIFQVKEAFLKSEMILENLNTTTTSGDILETFGMVYTNAMIGEDTLEQKKDVVIMIPTDKIVEDLKIFDGVRDPHSDAVNWALNNNSVLRNFSLANVEQCVTYNNIFKACECDSISIKIVENFGGNCCWDNYCNWIPIYCMGELIGCKCKFFFCQFNRLFLKIATAFDSRMRAIDSTLLHCGKRRLGAVIKVKRFQGIQRKWLNNPSSRAKYLTRVRKQLVRKKVLAKKEEPTAQEQKVMELTQLLIESDGKIQRGLRGMVKTDFVARCNTLDSLFKVYEVDNTEALVAALNQPLMEELGVNTMEALLDTLPKVNMVNLEVAYRNKKISYEDFKFYIFNSSQLGWKNLDVFADIPMNNRITIKVDAVPDKTTDSKLVYQKRNFVLPGKIGAKNFYFEDVPKKEEAWLIGIQYKNATPLFSMELVGMDKKNYALNLKEVSLEELKEKLKILDFEVE